MGFVDPSKGGLLGHTDKTNFSSIFCLRRCFVL